MIEVRLEAMVWREIEALRKWKRSGVRGRRVMGTPKWGAGERRNRQKENEATLETM